MPAQAPRRKSRMQQGAPELRARLAPRLAVPGALAYRGRDPPVARASRGAARPRRTDC